MVSEHEQPAFDLPGERYGVSVGRMLNEGRRAAVPKLEYCGLGGGH